MATIDYVIVGAYLIVLIAVGLLFGRRASRSIQNYFLGGRSLPWWMLGASGMASNLDVSGTMIIVAFVYVLGAQGLFLEIRGGVVLVMVFLMIFTGKWARRAGVMTNAEWMQFRFGNGRDGNVARIMSAVAEIIFAIVIVTYFAKGAGKFAGEFLQMPEYTATLLVIAVAMTYTIASGLYGVVMTDLVQGILIAAAIVFVCGYVVLYVTLPETFNVSVPTDDGAFVSVGTTLQEWTSVVPKWTLELPGEYSIYNLFGVSVFFYLLKIMFEGTGGGLGYMAQRFYAARNEREVGKLSLLWIILLSFRWPFIASIAILGIVFANTHSVALDPERVLPTVLANYFPAGIKGLLVAGLLAAGMSTFDSVVNGASAYWVKDIYQRFLNPRAGQKTLVRMSRIASTGIVVIGVSFSYTISNINDVWGWLTMSIGGGLLIPLLLRWYWWRYNGYGFALGTLAGILAAIAQRILLPHIPEYLAFITVSGLSLGGALVGTYATAPPPRDVVHRFYQRTRPFGIWKPVLAQLEPAVAAQIRREHLRDFCAILIAVPWHLTLFLFMMFTVTKELETLAWLGVLLLSLSILLYMIWYRHLPHQVPAVDSHETVDSGDAGNTL
jgi:Na+/proline symporter